MQNHQPEEATIFTTENLNFCCIVLCGCETLIIRANYLKTPFPASDSANYSIGQLLTQLEKENMKK